MRALGSLVVVVVAAFPAWAQEPTIIDGTLDLGAPDFVLVPFDVQDGTVEVEVRHTSVDDDDVVDFGVEDPNGFRGWGGGNDEPAIIGARAASRSYLPGPLPVGTWHVVVGKAKLVSATPGYRLEIVQRTTPTLADAVDRAAPSSPTLASEARFYAGDLHVHSNDSGDARASLFELAMFARGRGLDFVIVTDHNTSSHIERIAAAQPEHPALLLVPGMEFTTYQGHMGALGITGPVDHKLGVSTTLPDAVTALSAQGAVLTINHPNLDLGDVCIGCAWLHEIPDEIDAVEIATGGVSQAGFIFGEGARAFWEDLIADGRHIAPVGGSDDHRAGVDLGAFGSPIGDPTTLIFAASLSASALAEGVRDGRTVVKLQGPDDPMVVLESAPARVTRNGRADSVVVAPDEPVTLTARVTGAIAGDTFAFVTRGRQVAAPVPIDGPDVTFTLEVEAPGVGEDAEPWRAEVLREGAPRTIAGYVWVQTEATPAGCPGCTQSSEHDAAIVVGIALLGRRFVRRCGRRQSR